MNIRIRTEIILPSMLLGILTTTSVQAQNINYTSLEQIFGEPVTTGATGTPEKVSEAQANMTIITADEIRQSGSRNIPEILARVPGLDILRESTNGYDVGVRGYQQPFQPRLLVLLDGRQVFLDDYARTVWSNIPVNIDDIRQIEVVKGAASALYGSNAAGGVINIVTYNPAYDDIKVANVGLGTQNSRSIDGTVTAQGDWGGTKLSMGGMDGHEFNTARYPGDQAAEDPSHRYLANRSVFQVTPLMQIYTDATFARDTSYIADMPDGYTMGSQKTTTYSLRGGSEFQTPYGLINFSNYLNHSFVDLFEVTDGGAPYGFTSNLYVSQLEDQFKIGANHTFRASLEYNYKNFKFDGAQLVPQNPSTEENLYAASGVWLWKINNQLTLSNAARMDHMDTSETGTLVPTSVNSYADFSHSINTWSANSDLNFKASELDSFRVGYGRGVQLPSLINTGYSLFQNFGTTSSPFLSVWQGNPHLKPTVVTDYSADYTRKISEIGSDLKFSVFYEMNQDIVYPLMQVGTVMINGISRPFGESENVGNSDGYGGELQLKGKSDNGLRWDGSYSFTRVTDSQGVVLFNDYQGSTPQHHFRLLLGYSVGPIELDGFGQVVTNENFMRSPDGGVTTYALPTGGYSSFSARVGYKINDMFTAALSGTNLSRTYTGVSTFPAIERQVFFNVTGKFE